MRKTYAEFIAETLENKVVQIYFGDHNEETHYSDNSKYVAAVMVGRVVSGSGDCLVIDCDYVESHEVCGGNFHYVHTNGIKTITELNGKGSVREAFRSVNSLK